VRTVSPISRTGRSTAIGFRFAFFELAAQYHRAPEMPSHNAAADGFLPTRWSLVIKTRGDGDDARSALETLCSAYWFPLYSWSRRYGASPEDAEDFVQGFFVQILSRKLFASADPNLGRLRTFLITAFRRHVRDEKAKLSRGKRGGGNVISFNAADAESWYIAEQRDGESPDSMFDRQWALTVLERAIARLEAHAGARSKQDEFEVMKPFLSREGTANDYASAGAQLGMSASTFKVAVHRLRSRFREALRAEVADTQPDESSVDEEMRHLMDALRGP